MAATSTTGAHKTANIRTAVPIYACQKAVVLIAPPNGEQNCGAIALPLNARLKQVSPSSQTTAFGGGIACDALDNTDALVLSS